MAVTRMVEEVGRVLGGRYRVLAPIGRGASAQVFLADDVRLRRRVAVKMLHPALADDVDFLRRFQAEAQAAAALNHPHVLSVFDWGQDGEIPYLVTEYLGGGSLRTMLDQQRLLTQSQALVVGLEASRGLDYAHRRGLVHRDIKPANLLFGDDGRLRIADFGLARALAEAAWTEPQGAVLGTARYASPEQAQGQALTGRADVYSLALVLVEAVTGRVPFSADTTIGTLMARIDRPLEVPSALGPLREALEQAGRPQPGDRLDARALTSALMQAAERLPRPQPLPLAGAIVVEPTAESDLDPTAHAPSARSLEPTPAEPAEAEPVPSSSVDPDLTQSDTPMPLASFPRFGSGTDTEALPSPSPAEARGPKKARRLRLRLAVLGLALMVIAVVAAVVFANGDGTSPPVTHRVPDVVGETEAAARQELEPLGWKVAERTVRQDGTEAGQVLSTDPTSGGLLAEGRELTLIISDGVKTRPVPTDLRGKTRAQAVNQLKFLEFEPTVRESYDEDIEAGRVMGVEQGTPERVDRGDEVPLVVSKGPKPRIVPSGLTGLEVEDALAQLEAIQLEGFPTEFFSDSTPAGIVTDVDTPAGTEVPRGTTISLDVSKGPVPAPVPDIRQVQTLDEAATLLLEAGFKLGTVRGPRDGHPARTIPQRGTLLAKGSTVDLNMR